MASTSELLDRFVSLFNDGQLEEGQNDYAPDGYAEEIGTNRRMTPQESTASARDWKNAFPDARGIITTKIVDGNRGAAEIEWRGTNSGPLMGRPATGQAVVVRAALVIETNGSHITRSSHYIDVAGMMQQLAQGMQV